MSPDKGRLALLDTGFEGYPPEYVAHNVPLITLSGLSPDPSNDDDASDLPPQYRDGALKIHGDLPSITGSRAEEILEVFRTFERRHDQWDGHPVAEGSNVMGFKFRITGRVSAESCSMIYARPID